MVESMMRMSYPAFSSGVDIARMPRGAVASMLENEATKKTIFFEDFMGATLQLWMVRPVCLLADESVPKGRHQISLLRVERYARGNCNLSGSCKEWVNSLVCAVQPLCDPTSTPQPVPVVARPQEHKHDLSHRLLRHVATS